MQLRIISGSLKGRYLRLKPADQKFRPTSERVREAVADAVSGFCAKAMVADICAGSGAFGFEMLSRGAASVDFLELDRGRAGAIVLHAKNFAQEGRCRIITADARKFVSSAVPGSYDIVYYDPPYDDDQLAWLIPDIAALIRNNGICIVEHGARRDISSMFTNPARFIIRTRYYGETAVSFISADVRCEPAGKENLSIKG
jgi:16S rRNA (guanine966-N2)-methyltransferase